MENYLRLDRPAIVRLAMLRNLADEMNSRPHRANADKVNWRDVRRETFATFEPFFAEGRNNAGGVRGDVPVIIAFNNPDSYGWRMQYADEVEHSAINHQGWFQDESCSRATIRGLVIRLPRGRFLAGYVNNDNGEYVIFRELFARDRDAAQYGDKQAERVADDEREYSRRFAEATDMRERLEQIKGRLAELQVLIDFSSFEYVSREAARLTEEAAGITDKLNDEYSDIEF